MAPEGTLWFSRTQCGPAPWATLGCSLASFLCEGLPALKEGSWQGQWLSVRGNKSHVLPLGSLGPVGRGDGKNPDHCCHFSALITALEPESVHSIR